MDVCRRQRREDKCLDGTWCGDRLSKAVNASLLFLTCSQLILTFSMFLTLSLPAKRPRPMIGKGITKGTKKQSTLICSGDVTRVQYVSHSKCADGQVAIRRTIRLGDSANSFLERESVCVLHQVWIEMATPTVSSSATTFPKSRKLKDSLRDFAGYLPCPSPKTTCTGHIRVKKKVLQFIKLDGPKLYVSLCSSWSCGLSM